MLLLTDELLTALDDELLLGAELLTELIIELLDAIELLVDTELLTELLLDRELLTALDMTLLLIDELLTALEDTLLLDDELLIEAVDELLLDVWPPAPPQAASVDANNTEPAKRPRVTGCRKALGINIFTPHKDLFIVCLFGTLPLAADTGREGPCDGLTAAQHS